MAAVGIGDALDVVGKIPWSEIKEASVNEHIPLEIAAFWSTWPVKWLKERHSCFTLHLIKVYFIVLHLRMKYAEFWTKSFRWKSCRKEYERFSDWRKNSKQNLDKSENWPLRLNTFLWSYDIMVEVCSDGFSLLKKTPTPGPIYWIWTFV